MNEEISHDTTPSCVEKLRAALRKEDPILCAQLAAQAGALRLEAAIPLLRQMLRVSRRRWHDHHWHSARIEAINALANIGHPTVFLDVAQTVLDRSPQTQAAAKAALLRFGPAANPALLATLEHPGNWTVSGMRALLAALGEFQQPESAVALSRVILGELPRSPARWKAPLWTLNGLFLAGVAGIYLAQLFEVDPQYAIGLFGLICCAVPFYLAAYAFIVMPVQNAQKNRDMQALAADAGTALQAVGNRSVLPVIIAAAFGNHPRVRQQVARQSLKSLLPMLNAEDADFFPAPARTQLVHVLGFTGDPALNVAILRAMEHIGTAQALPIVTRLAHNSPVPEIQEEAQRVLPILLERQQRIQVSSTLLRAADQPTGRPTELLRPALPDTDTTPAQQLLRPGQAETE